MTAPGLDQAKAAVVKTLVVFIAVCMRIMGCRVSACDHSHSGNGVMSGIEVRSSTVASIIGNGADFPVWREGNSYSRQSECHKECTSP